MLFKVINVFKVIKIAALWHQGVLAFNCYTAKPAHGVDSSNECDDLPVPFPWPLLRGGTAHTCPQQILDAGQKCINPLQAQLQEMLLQKDKTEEAL